MSGADEPEVTLEALRTLLRMIEEKTRLVQLLDDYISADGLTIVIGIGAQRARPAALQPGRLDLLRRPARCARSASSVRRRMRYSKAINAVDSLSKAINRMVASRP